jgi:hypothetical protein
MSKTKHRNSARLLGPLICPHHYLQGQDHKQMIHIVYTINSDAIESVQFCLLLSFDIYWGDLRQKLSLLKIRRRRYPLLFQSPTFSVLNCFKYRSFLIVYIFLEKRLILRLL